MIKHASMIPLIGGMPLASEAAYGVPATEIFTYSAFEANESHLLNHYRHRGIDMPYTQLDKKWNGTKTKYDVIESTCPCAGLSLYSTAYGSDNPTNRFLKDTTKFVLSELRPRVYWGENAPALAGSIGKGVRDFMMASGKENGYSFSIYRTKSLLHGVPQVRERSFFFFWRGDRVPILEYYNKPWTRIEDLILSAKGNTQRDPINTDTPTEDPYYRYILDEIHPGMSHREFAKRIGTSTIKDNDVLSYIESKGYTYDDVGKYMSEKADDLRTTFGLTPGLDKVIKIYEREAKRCDRMYDKITVQGKNIMRRQTIIPRDRMGAFVGHYPNMLAHPVEDRYVDLREAMTIMGLPQDYELLNPKKSVNHICQNVPFDTAKDMATEVREYLSGNRPTIRADYVLQHNHTKKHTVMDAREQASLESFI